MEDSKTKKISPTPRGHHFVSRFYLKYFADSNDKIFVYDKEQDKFFDSTIKDTAKKKDLNRNMIYKTAFDELRKEAETQRTKDYIDLCEKQCKDLPNLPRGLGQITDPNLFENLFAAFENYIAPKYAIVANKNEVLSQEESLSLSSLIAFLTITSIKARTSVLPDAQSWVKLMGIIPKFSPVFGEISLDNFITSDSPVCFIRLTETDTRVITYTKFIDEFEKGKKNIAFAFPISSRKACIGLLKEMPAEKLSALFNRINFMQYVDCKKQIFAKYKQCLEQSVNLFKQLSKNANIKR